MRSPIYCVAVIALSLSGYGCSASSPSSNDGIGDSDGSGATSSGGGSISVGSGGTGTGAGPGTGSGGTTTIDIGGGSATGGTGNSAQSCDGKLKGYIRDFTPNHLDFEVAAMLPAPYPARAAGKSFAHEPGIVQPVLGADFKPVYAANATTGSLTTTGQANFDQWFRDTPGVNQGQELELQFVDPDGDKKFTFDNDGKQWFPIDGQLLGNYMEYANGLHNYHMTFELHSKFIYTPGMVFEFSGDDDVWVYINNQLVIDLGGVHQKMVATVALDALGLTAGSTYQLDFFWAERHIVDSNFKIETSIEFIDCGIEVPR